jgi:hypothetical protein
MGVKVGGSNYWERAIERTFRFTVRISRCTSKAVSCRHMSNDFHEAGLVKGNIAIESHSVGLMGRIKERYYILAREKSKLGNAEIAISAILPPFYPVKKKVSESVVV